MPESFARRAQAILQSVIDLEPEKRASHVEEACGGDAALLTEVRSLLDAHDRAATFLERPPLSLVDRSLGAGTAVGSYRVQSALGSGGMGTVYLALQSDPRRTVALKVLERGVASRSALQRFRHEAAVLARLDHPNIARVFEAGTHDDGAGGVPYFAMEYVDGGLPITRYADEQRLTNHERLELFATVCDAVHHGHQKGVIHRDLKPANVLVGTNGDPRVIDFGVARSTDADLAVTTIETNVGQLIGTLQYMSPEQCAADPGGIDTRSDVYSLGVLLYELICGVPPYDVTGTTIVEAARRITEQPPVPPSSVDRTVRGDLETIITRALAKDREQRYASATELGDEVRRFLRHEPIRARPPSAVYQFRMFTRRHRPLVVAGSLGIVALVGAAVSSTLFAIAAGRAESATQVALLDARRQAHAARIAASSVSMSAGDRFAARKHLGETDPAERGWAHDYLARSLDESVAIVFDEFSHAQAVSRDGRRFAVAHRGGLIVWDAASRTRLLDQSFELEATPIALSAGGERLAYQDGERAIVVVDVATGELVGRFTDVSRRLRAIAISPAGGLLVASSSTPAIHLWSLETMAEAGRIDTGVEQTRRLAFSADGQRIAAATDTGVVLIDVAARAAEQSRLGGARCWAVEFDASGERLLMATEDAIEIVAVPDLTTIESSELPPPKARTAMLGSDPGSVLVAGVAGLFRMHDAATGTSLRDFAGQIGTTTFLGRLEGDVVLTGSGVDVRLWSMALPPQWAKVRAHDTAIRAMSRTTDGRRFATAANDGTCALWNAPSLSQVMVFDAGERIDRIAVHPDGELVAVEGQTLGLKLFDAAGREVATVEMDVHDLAFHPGGDHLVAIVDKTRVVTLDAGTLVEISTIEVPTPVSRIAIAPAGRWIALGGRDGAVHLLDTAAALQVPRVIDTLDGIVYGLAFGGSRLAAGAATGTIGVYDLGDDGAERLRVIDMSRRVVDLAFSSDGGLLVSTSSTNIRTVWDTDSGQSLLELREPDATRTSSRASIFGPDERLLIGSGPDGILWINDAATPSERLSSLPQDAPAAEREAPASQE